MKGKTVFGALLVSVALCSQGFGFDLLDRMLGLNCGGCGTCNSCCETACCEPAAKCCAPEPACCEPECCEPQCCKPACDLFAGLKGLFDCRRRCTAGCCEPECCEAPKCCTPEPQCCEPACCEKPKCCEPKCCEPACCEKPDCCEPDCCNSCRKKRCICLPNLGLLDGLGDLFKCRRCCRKPSCCGDTCCGAGCNGGAAAPAQAPDTEAAPLPKAPVADPSASIYRYRRIVRN